MKTVRYVVDLPNDNRSTTLGDATRAVLAASYEHLDDGQGGITFDEIHPNDVQMLDALPLGSEVFVESPEPTDCLFDDDEKAQQSSHIWWRAVLVS